MTKNPDDDKKDLDETKRLMARLAAMPHKPHKPLKKKETKKTKKA